MPDLNKYKTPEIKNLQNHKVWDESNRDKMQQTTNQYDKDETITNNSDNLNITEQSIPQVSQV